MIEVMKSMIEYDLNLGSSYIDRQNLRSIDFTCADLNLTANFNDQSIMNDCLETLVDI